MTRSHTFSSLFVLPKRVIAAILLFPTLMLSILATGASTANALTDGAVQLNAGYAILMDAETSQVLYQYNADMPAPPASMAKMMTEYLVHEAVNSGRLSWDQVIVVGENAALQKGSRIFLAVGDKHTVQQLYAAMAVGSANDATVQLAEAISGTEEQFAHLMNETAKQLGLDNSYFINSTGLDYADMPEKYRPTTLDGETTMSARDAATLAYHILKEYPEMLETSKLQSYKFRERDKDPIYNINWMLGANVNVPTFRKYAYEGVDGLKTGHTETAGNNFTGTAIRNGTRLIAVVMNVPGKSNEGLRFLETAKLFDYGFNSFEKKTIIEAKAAVLEHEKLPVKKGKATSVSMVTASDVTILIPKGQVPQPEVVEVTPVQETLTAPVLIGDKVATVTYKYKDPSTLEERTVEIDLIASEEVDKAGWLRLLFRAIKDFFVGLFNSIVDLF